MLCTKCGSPCSPTASEIENHMIWCRPCRRRQRSHTPEYQAWAAAKRRCYVESDKRYPDYGGRGIVMHPAWRESFDEFLAGVGHRPSPGFSLDRVDNNKGYEPGNCRWATRSEQQSNTRRNRLVTLENETLTVYEAARRLGLDANTLHTRLVRGWSVDRALQPIIPKETP